MSDSLEQIHERLLSLEQPYRSLSEAVAAGVLKALKEANLPWPRSDRRRGMKQSRFHWRRSSG